MTENGIIQAKKARQWFLKQGIKFDTAFSSTKECVTDTLEIVGNLKDEEY